MFELKIDQGEIYCSTQLSKKSDEVFEFFQMQIIYRYLLQAF